MRAPGLVPLTRLLMARQHLCEAVHRKGVMRLTELCC
jgi:hypothetical protein